MLKIVEIEVDYTNDDDDSENEDLSGESKTLSLKEKVKPGTEIEIKFKLENRFDNDYDRDGELENILLTIEADDDDVFADSFDEEHDIDNIEAGKKEDYTVTFTVDEEAEEEEYTFEITLEAEDGESLDYKLERELTIELGRERDDVRITKMVLAPAKITTCTPTFTLDVELKNVGTRDQKYAGFSVYNSELGINENIQNIDLERFSDKDNSWSKMFTFSLKDVKEGLYSLDIRSYYQKTKVVDIEKVNVNVGKCATVAKKETKQEPKVENKTETQQPTTTKTTTKQETTTPEKTTNTITSGAIVKTVEDPYSQQDFMIAIILVAIALLVIIIIIFFIILLK